VTLNLSKSGGSLSFGPPGAKLTLGPHGKRATLGLPGTGLFYTTKLSGNKATSNKGITFATFDSPSVSSADRLTLGFFKRLITPPDEQALVAGCRELVLGDKDQVLALLNRCVLCATNAHKPMKSCGKNLGRAANSKKITQKYRPIRMLPSAWGCFRVSSLSLAVCEEGKGR